jgi:hypothetical protein
VPFSSPPRTDPSTTEKKPNDKHSVFKWARLQYVNNVGFSIYRFRRELSQPENDLLRDVVLPFDGEGTESSKDIIKGLGNDLHLLASHEKVLLDRCPLDRRVGAEMVSMRLLMDFDVGFVSFH